MKQHALAALFLLVACSSGSETGSTTTGSGGIGAQGGTAAEGGSAAHGASSTGGAGAEAGGAQGGGGGSPVECSGTDYALIPGAITACDGLGPGAEDCHYRVVYHEGQCCPGGPCDRLLVYWAGGDQSCDGGGMDGILQRYADFGFVAACAQPYTTDDEGGMYPYHVEFDRMNRVMQAIRADAADVWTGEKLLIGGNSHGGTAPLVNVAATDAFDNHAAVWTGTTHTAMMLNDGISNPRLLEEWAGATSGCGLMHARWVGRYHLGTGPLVHSCSNDQCYCSGLADTSDWDADTVVIGATDPTSPYGCSDFEKTGTIIPYRFVSCTGTGAEPCGLLGDIIPDEQQSMAYEALDACTGIDATYELYPDCSHLLCGGFTGDCGGPESLTWLSSLGW